MQVIKMSGSGFTVKEIADFFKVSTRAVYGWLATYVEFGQNGLLAKEGAGRPPKLNEEQMRWISCTVRDNTPNQLRFDFGLWTLRLIGQLIERQFGTKLSLPTLGKIMARLGFTAQRPLHRAYEQDATPGTGLGEHGAACAAQACQGQGRRDHVRRRGQHAR